MNAIAELLRSFRNYVTGRPGEAIGQFIAGFDWPMPGRMLSPRDLPVTEYLRAAALSEEDDAGVLLGHLSKAADELCWGQTYSAGDFGADFLSRYGWVELFGTRGHFDSEVMAGGFLLLGPEIHYPDHHHIAEEIYIPLTPASLWSKDGGPFIPRDAGEVIHHPSNIRHAMQTGSQALVALYLWRGGPLAQKSVISGKDR